MRLNQFIAQATGISRRQADNTIAEGRVQINGTLATIGYVLGEKDTVTLDGQPLVQDTKLTTIILNKPTGYVCSRNGQGSQTVYDLLPSTLHHLKPVGRLDKDSSGLLLLTNDGILANKLTHPRYAKTKIYEVRLSKRLSTQHAQMINDTGVQLLDGPSHLKLKQIRETIVSNDNEGRNWQITMQEGRNRQIRRTFATLGYNVASLHRTNFGAYQLGNLPSGQYTST